MSTLAQMGAHVTELSLLETHSELLGAINEQLKHIGTKSYSIASSWSMKVVSHHVSGQARLGLN
jgi:hypothetical protein